MTVVVAAVDLGASGGRVVECRVGAGILDLNPVHRFPNRPVLAGGTLHWDVLSLFAELTKGLGAVHDPAAVGIDSWAVDHGLLDAAGALISNPVHYRDRRTAGVREQVSEWVPDGQMWAITGIQPLPFNTSYQLVAMAGSPAIEAASALLLLPDLMGYWLTGEVGAELTNASTTQLLDARTRGWSVDLARRLGIRPEILPPIRQPGTIVGPLRAEAASLPLSLDGIPVVAVASHDTASAVAAVPAAGPDVAYISCGTWSLVGIELSAPVLSDEARLAGFTNEAGIDGTVRFQRNVAGLWLLQECLRTWQVLGEGRDLEGLLQRAAAQPARAAVVDPDHAVFLAPGDMPSRLAARCRATGQQPPATREATVRCVIDSLALAHRRAVRSAGVLSGVRVAAVHLVGGGAANNMLCQQTADACGVPVLAGPVEATAIGNALVQARALGVDLPDLEAMRRLVRGSQQVRRYHPSGDPSRWDAAEALIGQT